MLKSIAAFGTNSSFSTLTNRRISVCNLVSMLCVAITIFFIFFYFSINQSQMAFIEVVFAFFYMLPILFNYLRHTVFSRIYFNIVVFFHIFFLAILLGPLSNMYVLFIPTIMLPFILFEFSEKKLIAFFTISNVILVSILYKNISYDFNLNVNLSNEQISLLNKVVFYVTLLCCVIIIYSLLYLNEQKTKQLDIDKETLTVQLETIFNNSADAIFLVKADNRKIIKVNKRAVELFEVDSEDYFFSTFGLDLHKNSLNEGELLNMRKVLDEKGVYTGEVLYKTKKDNEFWGAISIKIVYINEEKYQSVRVTDISEQKKNKQFTESSLKEKELLLAEIHHRVKNNLAIISALINLQIENLKDESSKTIFEETKDRIYSMALIHNELYQNKSFAQIEFAHYINTFCSYLTKSYQTNPNITLLEKTEKLYIDIKTAIPCALILNELVTNSIKHAFKNKEKGQIEVGLKRENSSVLFWVADNGVGMDSSLLQSNSMGMSIITSLIEQIDGKIEYQSNNGSLFLITFLSV